MAVLCLTRQSPAKSPGFSPSIPGIISVIRSLKLGCNDFVPENSVETPSHSAASCEDNRNRWDSPARVADLELNHGFLVAFVNSKLPREVRCHVGASDVVQSVLFSASRNVQAFRGTSEREFLAWILEIARNRITDGIRRFRAYQYGVRCRADRSQSGVWDVVDDETPSQRISMEEDATALIRAIELLPWDRTAGSAPRTGSGRPCPP